MSPGLGYHWPGMPPEEFHRIPPVVGITGKAGSGKDRFYSLVLSKLGYTKLALADGVRVLSAILMARAYPRVLENDAELLRVFPSIYRDLFTMEKPPMARTLLQYVGTEFARGYDPDYWIKALAPLVEERLSKGIPVAITDVRFPNEAQYVRSLGGVVVRVSGEGRYAQGSYESMHASERTEEVREDMTDEEFVLRFAVGVAGAGAPNPSSPG